MYTHICIRLIQKKNDFHGCLHLKNCNYKSESRSEIFRKFDSNLRGATTN